MSYWSQNSALSSQLDDLLGKEDVSLRNVMDEPEVIQECKSQNKKLIDYLARVDVLRELITLTTSEPAEDSVDAYKYPNIACELLTTELPQIVQTLACEPTLLGQLYAFLEVDPPLNPLLASFFSRIMGVLITKTSEQNWFAYQVTCLQVLEFLKSKGNYVALLLRHIGTSAMMDLILKMYTKIEGPEIRDNFLTWLDENEFLEQLVSQLSPENCPEVRSNVYQLLCDLVLTNRESNEQTTDKPEEDPIAKKIESEEFVKRLLEQMLLTPYCEGNIVGVISVLLTLLGNGKRDEYPYASWDVTPSPDASSVTENTVLAITPHLHDLLNILHNPPPKSPVRTTVGELNPPLGATRVEVVRLLAALVATGNQQLLNELQQQDILNVLLDLFFQYPWNNFLHAQVEATLLAAFKSTTLVNHIFSKCRLLQRILEAWKDNDAQEKDKKPRRGYMGHVIRISNHVVTETGKAPLDAVLSEAVDPDTLAQWQEFVTTALAKVNGDQSSGVGYTQKRQEENDNEEFYQELYRRYYQLQALSTAFPDNFCDEQQASNEADGNENEEKLLKPTLPNAASDAAMAEQAELFNQVCSQEMQSMNDDAEMWSSIMRNSSEEQDSRAWNDENSSDEDDDEDRPKESAEWVSAEETNPWISDVLSTGSPPDQGWANFEASPFLANFGFDLSSTIATSAPGDIERVPFDLTPTENPQLFFDPASDWANETDAPSEWAVTPPSENPPSQEEIPSEGKEEVPPPLPDTPPPQKPTEDTPALSSASDTSNQVVVENAFSEEAISKPTDDIADSLSSSCEEMETAHVVESESSAQIVTASDIMSQNRDSSSCLQSEREESSSNDADSPAAAFPSETVIIQTDVVAATPGLAELPSNIPSGSEHIEVASQLAALLIEVSDTDSSSECRTLSDVTNGPAGDCDAQDPPDSTKQPNNLENSRNDSPIEVSTTDLQAPQDNADNVPKVTNSKIAVNEDEIPSNDVTAI